MPVLVEHDPASPEPGREDPLEVVEDTPKPLLSHLDDLRTCIVRAIGGLILTAGIAYSQFPRILKLLMRPPIEKLVFTSPMEPFFAQCKVALALGVILSFPWLLYQAWRFVSPGLRPRERALLLKLIPASYALFLCGALLGLFVAIPVGLKFLLSYSTERLLPYITLTSYLTYITYMTLGLGTLFQLPMVLCILSFMGIVSRETLAKYRRHTFLGILIVAAAISPSPDISGQLLVALPTYLLYEISLLVMRMTGPRAKGSTLV